MQRSWPRKIPKTLKPYPLHNVSRHVLPPPFPPTRGEELPLALRPRAVNTSDQELLTPSCCCRCLPLQQMLLMSKPPDVQNTMQSHVLWYERKNDPPHTCYKTANPPTPQDRSLDVSALLPRCWHLASWPSWSSNCSIPICTNNQCYFIF